MEFRNYHYTPLDETLKDPVWQVNQEPILHITLPKRKFDRTLMKRLNLYGS